MDLGIKGKTALVCGGSSGLGFASAKSLAKEGARVVIVGRDPNKLNSSIELLRSATHSDVYESVFDLSQVTKIESWFQDVKKSYGPFDILVNNVGGPKPTTAIETSAQDWQTGFEQVFLSISTLSKLVIPDMKTNGFGRIISITSLSAVEPIESLVISSSMRAALTAFHKTLANEVGVFGITVNTVMPGVIHTQRIEQLRSAKAHRSGTTLDFEMQQTAKQIPVGRMGRPEELGDLVAFLASTRASYIHGANIPVDGALKRGWM